MLKAALENPGEKEQERRNKASRIWGLRFFRSPIEVLADPNHSRTAGIRLAVNRLEVNKIFDFPPEELLHVQRPVTLAHFSLCDQGSGEGACAVLTGEVEDVTCGLVISSIGYKSLPIDPLVPFEPRKAIVPNTMGRVHQATGTTQIHKRATQLIRLTPFRK